MGTLMNKMKQILILLIIFKMSNLSNAVELSSDGLPTANTQMWSLLEKSIKKLEKAFEEHKLLDLNDSNEESEEAIDVDDNTDIQEGFVSPGFFFNNKNLWGSNFPRPWWRGKHVCESQEVRQTQTSGFTSIFGNFESITKVCSESNSRYSCKTTVQSHDKNVQTIANYDCCEGYRLQKRRCTKYERFNLSVTARKEAPEFTEMLEATGILQQLENDKLFNYTLFVSADSAIDELRENFVKINQLDEVRRRRQLEGENNVEAVKKILMNHVVNKIVWTNDLYNNQILETMGSRKLRYNIYPKPTGTVRTVNCKKIVKSDESTLKGIVHVVDGVLKPNILSIALILTRDSRFDLFMAAINELHLFDVLSSENITVFAPTNEVMALKNSFFRGCNGATPKHHIVNDVLCSAALDSGTVTTMSGKDLHFTHPEDSPITIDGNVHIIESDIIASNGVIHVLDASVLPDTGKNISQSLNELNLTTFESLLRADFDRFPKVGVTWLIPSEPVFQQHKERFEELRGNREKLHSFILSHTLDPSIPLRNIKNGQQLISRGGTKLNFKFYSIAPSIIGRQRATVNCVPINMEEHESCRAYIYEIEGILDPMPSLRDIINNEKNGFSILKKVIENAGMENLLTDISDDGITFLAPTDSAFESLDTEISDQLLTNSTLARQVLMGHVLPEVTCCHGILSRSLLGSNYAVTKGDTHIRVYRDSYGRVHFGPAEASKCDLVAENGVIHAINSVIIPEERRHNIFSEMEGVFAKTAKNPNMEVLLFGL